MSGDERVFEGWAILELMGHRRLAGYVTEVEIAGQGFLRVDIAADEDGPAVTQFYSPGSVYALTPVGEATARLVRSRPSPVNEWEVQMGNTPRPELATLPGHESDEEEEY